MPSLFALTQVQPFIIDGLNICWSHEPGSENIVQTLIQILNLSCDLDLQYSNPIFSQGIFQLMMMYHQTKFGYKSIPLTESTVKKKSYRALSIMWALTLTLAVKIAQPTFSHNNLAHADRRTTTPSLVAKGSAIQKISSQQKPRRHKDKWFQYNPSPNFVLPGDFVFHPIDKRGIKIFPHPPPNPSFIKPPTSTQL